MCHGIAAAHPELEFVEQYKVVKKREINEDKVTLISGGGKRSRAAHAGFVGKGVCWTRPSAAMSLPLLPGSGIQRHKENKVQQQGTLLIVKNYSGDCMNFNNAAFDAKEDGIEVDAVYVNDDIAVKDSLYTVGRRGVAGYRAFAQDCWRRGHGKNPLAEVKALANKVIANVSFGFALTSCTVPAKGTPTFDIGPDEMEFGVGIHGEPGRTREKIQSADVLSARITKDLIDDLGLKAGEEVCLLINGFGGTPFRNSMSSTIRSPKTSGKPGFDL